MRSFYAYYYNVKGQPVAIPLQVRATDKRAAFGFAYEFKQRELKQKYSIKSIRIMEVAE